MIYIINRSSSYIIQQIETISEKNMLYKYTFIRECDDQYECNMMWPEPFFFEHYRNRVENREKNTTLAIINGVYAISEIYNIKHIFFLHIIL